MSDNIITHNPYTEFHSLSVYRFIKVNNIERCITPYLDDSNSTTDGFRVTYTVKEFNTSSNETSVNQLHYEMFNDGELFGLYHPLHYSIESIVNYIIYTFTNINDNIFCTDETIDLIVNQFPEIKLELINNYIIE